MGKLDIAQTEFLRNTNHFADIWNGLMFKGKQVLSPGDLTEISPVGLISKKETYVKKTAVMVMAKTKNGERLGILITENQATIDYSLAVRVHTREMMEYDRQVSEIIARNKKTVLSNGNSHNKSGSSGEFLYGFSKTDKLRPISTLILYWGNDPWDGATNLHDMIDFSDFEDIKECVADFHMNIVDLSSVNNITELFNDHEVIDVISLFMYRNDKVLFMDYCLEHGKNITGNCRNMISQLVSSKELTNYLDRQINKKGDEPDMCKAITELIEDGRIEGRAEGRAEGKYENMVTLINDGDISIERAASKFNITPEEFTNQAKAFGLTITT